jgi:Trypsin-co-occurring domain 2
MANVNVGLANAIAALREELVAAMDQGEGAPMRFGLGPIQVTLQVAVTTEAGGKIGWHVVGLGASRSSSATQTLLLHLEPVWRRDDGSYTGDFVIAGQSARSPHVGPQPGKTQS